jgi:putative membrane protein
MKLALYLLWAAGFALFLGLISYHGLSDVAVAVAAAGWGLGAVVAYHAIPLLVDTFGWLVLLPAPHRRPWTQLLAMRWIADSVNQLLPVATVGGELVRAQRLSHTSVPGPMAGATVVVDLTAAVLTQIAFALLGLALLLLHGGTDDVVLGVTVGIGTFSLLLLGFFLAQRAGMFESLARILERVASGGDWLSLIGSAAELDRSVTRLYQQRGPFWSSCAWHFAFWMLGTGEVWLAMHFLGHPVTLLEALVLESLVGAVRAAAFAVPGGLGVQEGGFIVLGSLLGVDATAALSLSLVKRVRELAFGLPGLLVWQLKEGRRQLRKRGQSDPSTDQLSNP